MTTTTTRAALSAALPLILTLAACGSTTTEYVEVSAPASTYLVEYVPGMMDAAVGKSTFQLRVRNRATSQPVAGLAVSVKPVMYMTGMSHGSPADVVTESATPGTYDCAIYYLMMSGPTMGYWDFTATIGTEKVVFTPSVGMAMVPAGDSVRVNLWGPSDAVAGSTSPNKYYLFNDGPLSATAGSLKLHVSRSENMMMDFKPIHVGSTLAAPAGTVTSVTLTASADAAFTTPLPAVHSANGHWSVDVSSLGLAIGTQETIYLKLNVNGEDKTADGLAVSASNASVAFKVTPSGMAPVPASTYLVEYLPGMMGAVVGKTTFQLRVRTRADYKPATGLAVTVKPVMTMPTYDHSAPADVVTESATTPGTYDCAVYYQMASGPSMGYWELVATIGTEKTTFTPSVTMAMGTDSTKVNLWGVSDAAVPDTASTKYVIFRDGPLTAAGPLKLYVSRAEEMMMTFKPVSVGSVLGGSTGTVTQATLTVSADAAFTNPVVATDGGLGHWSVNASSLGLVAGTQATLYVKLNVNGEDKTTNGLQPTGANASVAFKVTPQ